MKITAPNITPGDFSLSTPPSSLLGITRMIRTEKGDTIAEIPNDICRESGEIAYEEIRANARFLAASKKMAESLLTLFTRASSSLDQSATHDGLQNCDTLRKARAALESAGYTFSED